MLPLLSGQGGGMPGVVLDHGTYYTDNQVTWETPDPPTKGRRAPRNGAPAYQCSDGHSVRGSRVAGEQKQDPFRW